MNDEGDLDHNVERDAVDGTVDCVGREEVVVVQALNKVRLEQPLDLQMYHGG